MLRLATILLTFTITLSETLLVPARLANATEGEQYHLSSQVFCDTTNLRPWHDSQYDKPFDPDYVIDVYGITESNRDGYFEFKNSFGMTETLTLDYHGVFSEAVRFGVSTRWALLHPLSWQDASRWRYFYPCAGPNTKPDEPAPTPPAPVASPPSPPSAPSQPPRSSPGTSPSVPVLISPDDGLTVGANQTLLFQWSDTGAASYKFEAWKDPYPASGAGTFQVVSGTSFSFAPNAEGSWRWQVRSVQSSGQEGPAPHTRSFGVGGGGPSWPGVPSQQLGDAATWYVRPNPMEIELGTYNTNIQVGFTNTGSSTWTDGAYAAQMVSAGRDGVVWPNNYSGSPLPWRLSLQGGVSYPGAQVTWTLTSGTFYEPGQYWFVYQMAYNGAPFGDQIRYEVLVLQPPPVDQARWSWQPGNISIDVNGTVNDNKIGFDNTGTTTWITGSYEVRLVSAGKDGQAFAQNDSRSPFPWTLSMAPNCTHISRGQGCTWTVASSTFREGGSYWFTYQMTHSGMPFGDQITFRVTVRQPPDRIHNIRVLTTKNSEVDLLIDYQLVSRMGGRAFVGASALKAGKELSWFGYVPGALHTQTGTTYLRLLYGFNQPPQTADIDQLAIYLYDDVGSIFFWQTFDLSQKFRLAAACVPTGLPPAPVVRSPRSSEQIDTLWPSFAWSEAASEFCTDSYALEVRDDSGNNVIFRDWPGGGQYVLPAAVLPWGQRYRLYVWPHNSLGFGAPGKTSFGLGVPGTPPRPSAPQLLSPADTSSLSTMAAVLNWENEVGTTQVHVRVIPLKNDGPGVDMILGSSTIGLVIPTPLVGTGPYILLPDMTYQWMVRTAFADVALDGSSALWGPWSAPRTFRTPKASSGGIGAVTPAHGSMVPNSGTLLQWQDSNWATFYYEIQVSPDAAFGESGAIAPVWWNLVHGGVTTPLNSWRTPSLLPGRTYFWRVRPRIQGDGMPAAWSQAWSFRAS